MINFLFEQLPGLIVGVAAMLLLATAYNVTIDNPSVRREEGERIEAATRAKALELIKKRSEDNEEISEFDAAQLCVELGGRWVQSDCVD